jgi:hypothetical protein
MGVGDSAIQGFGDSEFGISGFRDWGIGEPRIRGIRGIGEVGRWTPQAPESTDSTDATDSRPLQVYNSQKLTPPTRPVPNSPTPPETWRRVLS